MLMLDRYQRDLRAAIIVLASLSSSTSWASQSVALNPAVVAKDLVNASFFFCIQSIILANCAATLKSHSSEIKFGYDKLLHSDFRSKRNIQTEYRNDGLLKTLTPEDFGAKGDGTTDDAAAINKYFAFIRENIASNTGQKGAIFGAGRPYYVSSPLNFTGLSETDLNLNGSHIISAGGSYAVIDALASNRVSIHNGWIFCGSQSSPCTNGLQMGRNNMVQGYPESNLQDIKIDGYFSQAPLFNNSETLTGVGVVLINRYKGKSSSYGLIQDGVGHFPVKSIFQIVSIFPEAQISFNENSFTGLTIYNIGNGPGLFLAGSHRHNYQGYIQVQNGYPAASLYFASGSGGYVPLENLTWNVHSEIMPTAEFLITGTMATPRIDNLIYRNHLMQSATVFKADNGITGVTILGSEFAIPVIYRSDATFFDQPSLYSVNADVEMLSRYSASWNAPAFFSGRVLTDRATGWTFGNGVVFLETPAGLLIQAKPAGSLRISGALIDPLPSASP